MNEGRTTCTPCPAGEGPNDDYTGCDACLDVFYSPFGVCQECLPPAIPIMGNMFCSETVCRPGSMCPEGATCKIEADCIACSVGTVGLGGDCTECTLDGSVANKLQSACEQCFAGKMPHANRSGCSPCGWNRYSTFGHNCDPCSLPSVVNEIRTVCSTAQQAVGRCLAQTLQTGGAQTVSALITRPLGSVSTAASPTLSIRIIGSARPVSPAKGQA